MILGAEDNKVNQKIMRKLLTKLGHSVLIANNGKEVVDMYEENLHPGVDLILMDVAKANLILVAVDKVNLIVMASSI